RKLGAPGQLKVDGQQVSGESVPNNGSRPIIVGGTTLAGVVNALAVDASGNLTFLPGTGASSLGKAEDDAHTTGDVGVMFLGVRRDSVSVSAGSNNEYCTINVDGNGRLYAQVVGSTAHGSAVVNAPVVVGGQDGTNVRYLKTDTSGQIILGAGVDAI